MVKPNSKTAIFIKWLLDSITKDANKIAVIDGDGKRETTYGELYDMACRVVAYLERLNLPAHSFIGICLPTSMEYIASEIGAWLAGHAIVPMGDQFPETRIRQIMEHCESPFLIDEKVLNEITSTDPIEPTCLPEEDDVNSLFYTSGSTGKPKGVIHTFRSFRIPHFPDEMFKEMNVSVLAVTAPMYFIACKLIYDFLTRGGTVNIVPPDVKIDIRKLESFLSDQRIEFVYLPPSVLAHFHNKSQSLKVVMSAAERLSGIGPDGYILINHCGQTETAGVGTMFTVDKPYDNTPIGIPAAPYLYNILDENGNEVAEGEEGELCYRGDLTPGYLKEPELTAELYRGGWLHTGDIVKKLPDGNLVFVNRKDEMLKINGQRVEPNEVETVFKKIPGIDDAIVKGFRDEYAQQYLCGFYISKSGVEEKEISDYLSLNLPSYMVPSYFVKMDSFPLNINGKTDRKSLLPPAKAYDKIVREPYEAPQNDVEIKLCSAFENTLDFGHVGVNEDFFMLGGDSIRVMKLQTLCPELPLSARLVYEYRTPRKIAKAIEGKNETNFERLNDYPLSQTQMGIYAESMMRQGEIVYNNGVLYRLGSGVDLKRLAKAFEAVIEAHPFVKTRLILDEDGNPRQRRNDDEIYRQKIETMSDADFEMLRSSLLQPFFLLKDCLFRIRLFDTPSAAYLFMDFHHIIFDGMSMGILLSDLEKAYHDEPLNLESFSGFEVAQEEEVLRNTQLYSNSKEWNLQRFGNLDITSLPSSDLFGQSVSFGHQELDLGLSVQKLEESCQRFGVTPNVFTIAVFGYLLGHYTYSHESLFATIYHGRHDLKLNHTVSMLVKTLPVHEIWDGKTTLSALLQSVKEQFMGSMANDLFSFAELKAANNYISSQVLFAYQGDVDFPDLIGGEPFTQLPLMENATGEPLAFEVSRNGDRLTLGAEYHSNAYSDGFINRMMQSYVHLVKTFIGVSDGNVPLMSLPLLSADESQALLAMGCGAQLKDNPNDTVVTLFRQQVALNPDAIAVVDRDSSLTYSELDRQSDCLAASLVKAGVVNDSIVALMLPRRKEFLVAVLAVFKAGGAYISLDYEYPQARIDFMLNDLDARFLITTSQLAAERNFGGLDDKKHVIMLDHFDFSVEAPSVDFSRPQSLAYIIYTSGTTGNPKGVMIEHHSLCSMLEWLIPMEELKAGDKCAAHPSFSFDASLPDLFGPLICGAQVHIMPSTLRYDIGAFSRYLAKNKITGLTMSTQIGMELLENHDLSLRYLFLGGENLHVNRKTSVKVINGYGPTEFTVCSSYHVVDQDCSYENIPIGRPVPGSRSLVVGPEGRLVPWGAMGELCLMGRQLARGYWHREQQTRERFVDCPFLPGERMYRTGDLVKWSQDGELLFHGRIDNQVKINGYRIELGEVESCMNAFPGIQASAVILCKQNSLQFLCGFYASDSTISPETLRKSMGESLPAYMVPMKLVQLDKMPMTPNGKIDRRQLAEQASNLPIGTGTVELPVNRREQVLLDLSKQLLGIDSIGVTDDLTMMGLSSLDAIKLSSLAEKEGLKLKVNDILNNKTIRNIAKQELAYGHWLNEYSPEKPIVVAIQGFSPHQVQNYFDALCEKFSVFNFASLDDYYDDFFRHQSKSEVLAKYVETLRSTLPFDAQIHAFTGHCVGGELAYRCAALWQAETGQLPKVFVLNTPFRTDDEVRHMMPSQDVVDQMPPERQQKLYDWMHQFEKVTAMLDGVPMPLYKGDVVFFRATEPFLAVNQLTLDSDAFARQAALYMQRWQDIQPNMEIIDIPTDHFTMLDPQYTELFLKEI